MYFICDDVTEKEFYKLEQFKAMFPNFKVNCFVMGKDAGDYLLKDWVETGAHGWQHDYPPECERADQRETITRALESLRKYLPEKFGFRAPGYQLTASSYPILKELGFYFIAHQCRIQSLNGVFKQKFFVNSHLYDLILENIPRGNYEFISNGFN